MTAEMVAQVRRFNRTVTQRIGVLNENFLASDRSLGQNRLLWEIGADGCDIRSLRAQIDLDSGYLSRLLRALETSGLIAIEQSATDGRSGPRSSPPPDAASSPRWTVAPTTPPRQFSNRSTTASGIGWSPPWPRWNGC